ncbi:hypothetical protein DPMN_122177, partial [Dreissena polymorpha]
IAKKKEQHLPKRFPNLGYLKWSKRPEKSLSTKTIIYKGTENQPSKFRQPELENATRKALPDKKSSSEAMNKHTECMEPELENAPRKACPEKQSASTDAVNQPSKSRQGGESAFRIETTGAGEGLKKGLSREAIGTMQGCQ